MSRRAERVVRVNTCTCTPIGVLARRLYFLSHYTKNPPEIIKDDFAYDRLLDFVHRVARGDHDAEIVRMHPGVRVLPAGKRKERGK